MSQEGEEETARVIQLEALQELEDRGRGDMELTVAEDFMEVIVARKK